MSTQQSGVITQYLHVETDPNSIASNQVSSVQIDSKGQVWIAMFGGGLDKLSSDGIFEHFLNRETNEYQVPPFITDASIDQNDILWMASDGWGVIAFDTRSEVATIYSTKSQDNAHRLRSNFVSSITAVGDEIWGASRKEIMQFAGGKVHHFEIPGESKLIAYAIEKDDQDHLWISTYYGLLEFDYHTGEVNRYDESHGLQAADFISASSLKLPNGRLIFGGPRGFNIVDPNQLGGSKYLPPDCPDRL